MANHIFFFLNMEGLLGGSGGLAIYRVFLHSIECYKKKKRHVFGMVMDKA